ncbi:hypothetical protein QE152_g36200 [Popillia japonica]|uniref:Uncharacterized protein n=1 Tax=Popillia japonica TaxID=7064 RepID=A0AAW1IDH0_POPJA
MCKNLSLSCDLGDLRETLVRDMFIAGLNINNRGIKEKLLQEDCLTLEKAIQIAKSVEITQQQAQQLTKKSEAMVQRIKRMGQESKGYEKFKKSQTGMSTAAQGKPQQSDNISLKKCKKCGQIHKYKCPAATVQCKICKKIGHFAKYCFHKHVKAVNMKQETDSSSDDSENLFYILNFM